MHISNQFRRHWSHFWKWFIYIRSHEEMTKEKNPERPKESWVKLHSTWWYKLCSTLERACAYSKAELLCLVTSEELCTLWWLSSSTCWELLSLRQAAWLHSWVESVSQLRFLLRVLNRTCLRDILDLLNHCLSLYKQQLKLASVVENTNTNSLWNSLLGVVVCKDRIYKIESIYLYFPPSSQLLYICVSVL